MKDYSSLPDGMTVDEVAREFEEALAAIQAQPPPSDSEVVTALGELADRQWHTYQVLRPDLRAAVEAWLHAHWSTESEDYVGQMVCIIGRLGLQSLMDRIEHALTGSLPDDVRQVLQVYLEETRGDVSDPFRGMKDPRFRYVDRDPRGDR